MDRGRNTQYASPSICFSSSLSGWPTPLEADEFVEFIPANPVGTMNYQPPAQANSFADLSPQKQQ
ncbi:MAG: hypothetical protein KJ063_16175 [Anaerolineae bacterium]|nr:hypothetical protein [Anaerolineae bacterium]